MEKGNGDIRGTGKNKMPKIGYFTDKNHFQLEPKVSTSALLRRFPKDY